MKIIFIRTFHNKYKKKIIFFKNKFEYLTKYNIECLKSEICKSSLPRDRFGKVFVMKLKKKFSLPKRIKTFSI